MVHLYLQKNSITDSISDALTEYLRETYTVSKEEELENDADVEILREYEYALVALRSKSNTQAMVLDLQSRGYDVYAKETKDFHRVIVRVHAKNMKKAELIATDLERITGVKPVLID